MSQASPRVQHGGGDAGAQAPRFYVHSAHRRAIPPADRDRLVSYLSVLSEHSERAEGRLIVTATRAELAEAAGVSEETTRRRERRLEELGLVRTLSLGRRSRVLEILPPPTVPLRPIRSPLAIVQPLTAEGLNSTKMAQRAVDNRDAQTASAPQPRGSNPSPVRGWNDSSPYSEFRKRESRRAGASTRGGDSVRPEPRSDFADRATGNLGDWVSDELERAGTGPAFRLTRTQRSGVRESIRKRVDALERSGAGETAETLARRDLERVLSYALRANRPAAHLAATLRGRDWHSHLVEGSEASRVAESGPTAEMPVHDVGSRAGAPVMPGDLTRAKDRLARAIEAAPLSPDQREQIQALAPSTAGEAIELAVQLERAAIATQAKN